MVGLKQTTIGMIERGQRGYGLSVVKIASALGVTPEELQGISPKPAKPAAAEDTAHSFLGRQLALTFDDLPDDRMLRNKAYIAASQVLIGFLPKNDDPATLAPGQRARSTTPS